MSRRSIKNILTCNIQIILKLDVSLKTYKNQVKNGTYEFPDYIHCCPICHGKKCAIRYGYYDRQVIDEYGTFFKEFPVARYLCQRKGKAKVKDSTFSLLPWQLVPFKKWTIELMFSIASYRSGHSIKESLDKFEVETIPADSELRKTMLNSAAQLSDITAIIENGLQKLKIFLMIGFDTSLSDVISYSLDYAFEVDNRIRGPTALSWDYYIKNGGYYENSQFLFGCAAQFR